jgi:hypothetical protein
MTGRADPSHLKLSVPFVSVSSGSEDRELECQMDSEEMARHIKEQEHEGKRGVFDAEARREKSKILRNVQELAKCEDFEGFSVSVLIS